MLIDVVITIVIFSLFVNVYYTGGKDYLEDNDDELEIFKNAEKEIEKSLEQYITRYEAGDKVNIRNVALWCKRNITHAIAEYLYMKGLKK